jgi:hypothetical protein
MELPAFRDRISMGGYRESTLRREPAMKTEQLDAIHTAKPFRAFTLHLADGTKHVVAHPEMMWRTPGGRTAFVSLGGEKVAIVDLLLVTQITHGNGSSARQRKRR